MTTPPPIAIAAGRMYQRLRREVLTVEALESALADVYTTICPDPSAHESAHITLKDHR